MAQRSQGSSLNNKAPATAAKLRHKQESYDRGVKAERWAGWIMRAKGFEVIDRRFKAKGGEIDLICRKEALLVFLEVKYRDSLEDALYSISSRNQSRIVTAASAYIASHEEAEIDTYRFDVLAFARGDGPVPRWQHLESAFEAF